MKNNPYLRQRYTLQSMAELRLEREKLRWRIQASEERLGGHYRRVAAMFTFANVVRMAFSRIENIQALIAGVRNGYDSISALFRSKKKGE